ncbi:DUF58 domain-containing protein [Robiginitalea sp. M366]|uniref:DUF58 domain-containing protein n=1 Tax=Robiginitalea aestuariiviva TaxID=3036903 RepID=UPI00240D33AE|nr:DUF58 domain-containing protein [Robiginitalea aestuariiviva]MDG1572566.1 DUF58 domain-containing protein [Robiginitalea aestuariiviva]
MRTTLRNLFLSPRFFALLFGLAGLFILAYLLPGLMGPARVVALALGVAIGADALLLYGSRGRVEAKRELPERFSNGDLNPVQLYLRNTYLFPVRYTLIEELPVRLQIRDFSRSGRLGSGAAHSPVYELRPTERGRYTFGALHVLVRSPLGLLVRRFSTPGGQTVAVYPSFLQLRKYELMAISNRLTDLGLKRIRRIGHTLEFEQIREYIPGDDVRNLNWKATAKRGQLMVNQYQDEKSQPIYAVIDTGRVMRMPFEGMSLLDYAINAALVLSRVAIRKQDKAGLMTFNRRVENRVAADRRSSQMQRLLETLYHIDTDFAESDFARLYTDVKRQLSHRSLLLLFTNFETLDALSRQLPYLQALQRQHLLVVVFFQNTELEAFSQQSAENVRGVYQQTIARKFLYEKKRIVRELNRHGIQALLTRPEDLTVATLNKYLEIKARGML